MDSVKLIMNGRKVGSHVWLWLTGDTLWQCSHFILAQ